MIPLTVAGKVPPRLASSRLASARLASARLVSAPLASALLATLLQRRGGGILRFFLLLTLLTLLLPLPAAAQTVEDRDRGVKVSLDMRWHQVAGAYLPILLSIENRGEARDLPILAQMNTYAGGIPTLTRSTLTVSLPARSTTQVELPLLRTSPSLQVSLTFPDGELELDELRWSAAPENLFGLVIFGKADLPLRWPDPTMEGEAVIMPLTVAPEKASRHWQTYAGLRGYVALDADQLPRLDPDQRAALKSWVCLGGGVLWIYGEGRETAAEALELPVPPGQREGACLTGRVRLTSLKALQALSREEVLAPWNEVRTAARLGFLWNWVPGTPIAELDAGFSALLEDLYRSPRHGFAVISTLFALLIGPVNLYLLWRRNRLILFYVTAPLLAGLGMASLVGWTLMKDGLDTKLKEGAVLLHDVSTGLGAVYHARGIFAALAPSDGLPMPGESLVLPLKPQSEYGARLMEFTTGWTGGQRLERGFVRSREASGLFTVTPARVRMGVSVRRDGNGALRVENGLSSPVTYALVRVPAGEDRCHYFEATSIQPGETRPLEAVKGSPSRPVSAPFFRFDLDPLNWTMFAEVDALPHLENGGVTGRVLEERYVYLGVGDHGLNADADR